MRTTVVFHLLVVLLSAMVSTEWRAVDSINPATCKIDRETRVDADTIKYIQQECRDDPPDPKNKKNSFFESAPPERIDPEEVRTPQKHIENIIEDYDQCIPDQEVPGHCQSNPDINACPDGTYPIVRQISDPEGRLLEQFTYCPNDKLPGPEGPEQQVKPTERQPPKISPAVFRTFPIRGSKIGSDPSKFTLRNGFTHFWASDDTQNFSEEIDGFTIRIKAIPVQWNWDYGDGSTRNFNVPGVSSPNHTLHDETPTSHVYKETGKFNVVVTTLYRGEFSVDGGAWQSIPGQAAVPSDPVVMDVWRTQKQLIAFD